MSLDGLCPRFAARCRAIERRASARNVPIRWTSGLRTWDEQAALYRIGRDETGRDPARIVTNAPPGFSWHNYGLAADFVLLRPDGSGVEWSGLADLDGDRIIDWQEVGEAAEAEGCEWGGRWPKLLDLPHVQSRGGLTLAVARTLFQTAGLPGVWAALTEV